MQRINNPRFLLFFVLLIIILAAIAFAVKEPEAEAPDVAEEMAPHPVFPLGPLEVTDTVVNTWAMMLMVGVGAFVAGRRLKLRPGMVQNALEWLVESLENLICQTVGYKDSSLFLPLVGTLAIFVGCANLLGLLPYLKSPTPDINTPLALALIVLVSVPYFGIRMRGLKAYLKHYVEPIFLVLPIELASEIARTFSLTFRLFGNMMAEEIFIAILFLMAPIVVPVPIQLFSILTGLLQAYLFALLTCVYIGGAIHAHT